VWRRDCGDWQEGGCPKVLSEVAICRHPMAYGSPADLNVSKDSPEDEGLSVAGVPMGQSHDYYGLSTADL